MTDDALRPLLQDFSLEVTGKDETTLRAAAHVIPPGTLVNITELNTESLELRVEVARAARAAGLVPVPHISARRLRSEQELADVLASFAEVDAIEQIFVVAGDRHRPDGPFDDALAVIRSGLLPTAGVRNVGISGYPEGHPDIDDDTLWRAIEDKTTALREQNLSSTVITQFGFDADRVLTWLERTRERGIMSPTRIGVPGPVGIGRLLRYASRFGVQSSAGIVQKYGFSLTHLLGTAGPDRFVDTFAEGLRPEIHGDTSIHFYTFGGILSTAEWVRTKRRIRTA